MVFILSERNDEIEDFVMNKIKIGATELKVRGGYKNEQKQMLLCVVHNTQYKICDKKSVPPVEYPAL